MQDHDGNDGTMVINARELLTADDCESIIRCDGYWWAMRGHLPKSHPQRCANT